LDRVEMEIINRGEAFFHVGGAGHEASAALARHLCPQDWLHLHYRDKALMLARGVPPIQFFHSLLCTRDSHSAGRQMSAHLSAPELNLLSLVGPVGNNALQAIGVALEIRSLPHTPTPPIVVCAMGDGTTQQGEVLEALSEAARSPVPVLFLIEDNGLAISTGTRGRTFFDRADGKPSEFLGIPIHRVDGSDPLACDALFASLVPTLRTTGHPAIVVLRTERLTHHTNADDERMYRSSEALTAAQASGDPIRNLGSQLVAAGFPAQTLVEIEASVETEIRAAAECALSTPNPVVNLDARAPWSGPRACAPSKPSSDSTSLLVALRNVLRQALDEDPRVSLFGEDIEDPKGDVFGLTRGLTRDFPDRVRNSALSESLITGASIGRALAGGRPIGFIQFADFLPLCFNQLASEAGSLWWRTHGGWTCPIVLMAPCGGYRPGLGPFHAQTLESTFAHIPGLDVVMPSNAEDAAGLLRAALRGGRPTLFLYPKVLLNDPSASSQLDLSSNIVVPGTARHVRSGTDLTLVAWGATVPLCSKAAEILAGSGISVDLIDLRSISPWDEEAVLASVRQSRKLIVVHEDNRTCGFGAEIMATAVERAGVPLAVRRVVRPDTYVPCNYSNQLEVLPSVGGVLTAAAELCDLTLQAAHETAAEADTVHLLEAVGSSPADQNVTVIHWKVRSGDTVRAGDLLAECEADKAAFDLRAPVEGVISDLLPVDQTVRVGTPMARIQRSSQGVRPLRRIPVEPRWTVQRNSQTQKTVTAPAPSASNSKHVIGLSGLSFVTGSRCVSNAELIGRFPGRSTADIVQRTGIESRHFCSAEESVLDLARRAAHAALKSAGLAASDLTGIVVSTSTPLEISPSLACRLHHELFKSSSPRDMPAHDVLAACTGWLYALQSAHDTCHCRPDSRILVVTAEAMSRFLNPDDFDTAIVFGDAATAVVVSGGSEALRSPLRVHRPLVAARGEDGSILNVGRVGENGCAPVEMRGVKVFPLAVRQMNAMLHEACSAAGLAMADLDWIVPHQANGRIIDAAQQRAGVPAERVVNNVSRFGNTSSSSIPIALAEMLAQGRTGRLGLAAFGGGFTFGAAVAEMG
jgi:2-oxoisovalerate dehydrogenase E1 component